MVHDAAGATALQPYGQREHEVIYSVGRAALNRVLIEEATRQGNVDVRFQETCIAALPETNLLRVRRNSGEIYETPLAPTIAADGAGSAIRASLQSAGRIAVREDWLDHDYKELSFPARAGKPVLDGNSLHIWPRGGYMLIALPNTDGTFTATLFLASRGPNSFAELDSPDSVAAFFRREFPDAVPLMPHLLSEFAAHPQGKLGTVHATPWHLGGSVLLLGDAAHAIVPFHGQGMNAAFEDCFELDALLELHADWESAFAALTHSRRPNTEAIAAMALENYTEMRHTVLDAGFVRRKAIAMELERRFPDRFIPRYSMVMFHPEIPYAQARHRGALQEQILLELDSRRAPGGTVDSELAAGLVMQRLPALR